ncbi:MAG: helix-turn-helix domain-containing protein [Opitutales bacterium]|nr:helix-turn-helix domain-containing protein [Opitutales bacterium]
MSPVGLLRNNAGCWKAGPGFQELADLLMVETEFLAEELGRGISTSKGGERKRISVVGPGAEERFVSFLPLPEGGDLKGVTYAVWEETEAAIQEQTLRRERDRFEALIDLSPEGFTIFDAGGVIVYESPTNQRLHGHYGQSLVGHSLFEFIHPDDLPIVQAQFGQLVAQPWAVDSAVVRWRHAEGHWIHFEGTVINLLEEPRIRGLINNFRDIGPRLQIEEVLREAKDKAELSQRIQRRFLTNLTHELRTPFTLIQQPLADLQEMAPPDLANHPHWGIIERNVARLDGLLSELIDLSYLELAEMPLQVSSINLTLWLKRWGEEVAEEMRKKKLRWRWEVKPVEEVFLDVRKMAKVVLNLFSNAIKFSPVKGLITVRLKQDPGVAGRGEGSLILEIEDEGKGVPPEERERVFERFYQVGGGIGRPVEGMGIGLALVRELVDLHGGEIVCLEGAGGGALLRLILPLGSAHFQPEDILVGESSLDKGGMELGLRLGKAAFPSVTKKEVIEEENGREEDLRPTLLLVEDNYDMRAFLVSHLVKRFRVIEKDSGEAALAYLDRGETPALLLLDVMMPGLDGFSVCREVRKTWPPDILPVVLLSAKSAHYDRLEGLRSGANDYLGKPFLIKELLNRLETLLPPPKRSSKGDHPFLEKFRQLVLTHLTDPSFTMAWLARRMGMSLRSLQRMSQETCGKSPGEMVNEYRLEAARGMLLEGSPETISEVAYAVGLSPNYFIRLFRSETGLTPAEFRFREGNGEWRERRDET